MADDGRACCYVLVENRSGRLAPRTGSWSTASNGWAVLVDPRFEFGDVDAELRQWSVGGRVARLLVIEDETFSHATLWADGELVWEVSYEAELDDRPLIGGHLPYDLNALAAGIGPPDDPRTWYEATVEVFRLATTWRPR